MALQALKKEVAKKKKFSDLQIWLRSQRFQPTPNPGDLEGQGTRQRCTPVRTEGRVSAPPWHQGLQQEHTEVQQDVHDNFLQG